jgi:hypothetical protein
VQEDEQGEEQEEEEQEEQEEQEQEESGYCHGSGWCAAPRRGLWRAAASAQQQ